jgi:hypothetical protein
MALERELATYEAKVEELLAQEGKHVVIHGETVVGTWDTHEEALTAACERCGRGPFLVKQIARVKGVVGLPPCNGWSERTNELAQDWLDSMIGGRSVEQPTAKSRRRKPKLTSRQEPDADAR